MLSLRPVVAYARSSGVDVDSLLAAVGLTVAELREPTFRVSDATRERLWHEAAARSSDEAFGLHAAEHFPDGAYDVLDYVLCFSSTLRDGLDRMIRFHRINADAIASEVSTAAGETRIRRVVTGTDPHEQDGTFGFILRRFQQMSGCDVRPRAVAFAHTPHAVAAHDALFRCPIRFGAPWSELAFDAEILALPVEPFRPRLLAVLERHAADLLARLPAVSTYAGAVRSAVVDAMRGGPPTLERVARSMRSSPRTLQRRLRAEGTTLQLLVEEVRREAATRYLTTTKLSITEIAFLLGFEEESGFRRSFRRWTGKSPSRVRADATRAS
jgi:AraC-like DNA-binding protein